MADHLHFLGDNSDKIEAAGPMMDGRTQEPAGGLWIVEADDTEQVQALVEADAFWRTGLRKSIQILEGTQVCVDGRKQI